MKTLKRVIRFMFTYPCLTMGLPGLWICVEIMLVAAELSIGIKYDLAILAAAELIGIWINILRAESTIVNSICTTIWAAITALPFTLVGCPVFTSIIRYVCWRIDSQCPYIDDPGINGREAVLMYVLMAIVMLTFDGMLCLAGIGEEDDDEDDEVGS